MDSCYAWLDLCQCYLGIHVVQGRACRNAQQDGIDYILERTAINIEFMENMHLGISILLIWQLILSRVFMAG